MDRQYYLSIVLVLSFVFFSYQMTSAFADDSDTQKRTSSTETPISNYRNVDLSFKKIPTQNYHTIPLKDSSSSKKKKVYLTIRLGQGGFRDDRSPIGKLGGGQLTLDIKPVKYPIALSITNEYYTNSAYYVFDDPPHKS